MCVCVYLFNDFYFEHSLHLNVSRHGTGEVVKNSISRPLGGRRRRATGSGMSFWHLKAYPQCHTSSNKLHLLILPSSDTPWWTNIQIYEPMRSILTQTSITTDIKISKKEISSLWGGGLQCHLVLNVKKVCLPFIL